MAVPVAMATVDLQLRPIAGNDVYMETRQLEVYRDHLERDFQNFEVGIVHDGPWKFTRYGLTVNMTRWNCHGSTWHHYNGTGNGLATGIPAAAVKNTVVVTHQAGGGGTHPPLGPLVRGDIIAYYMAADFDGDGKPDLMHSQTVTGNGDETYGANNEPLSFPGAPVDQSWEWATSPAGAWANNLWLPGTGVMPVTIRVYSKP